MSELSDRMRSQLRRLARQQQQQPRHARSHNHGGGRHAYNNNSHNNNNKSHNNNNNSHNNNSKPPRRPAREGDNDNDGGGSVRSGKRARHDAPVGDGAGGPSAAASSTALGVVPSITLDEMGGLSRELPVIRELVQLPICSPDLFRALGADPPCGVLLHGPPGVGKTRLVHAIAGTLRVPLFFVAGPEIVSGISGDSEATLRQLFVDAVAAAPSLVFIDEIDTIAGRREDAHRAMEARIVAQLLASMDQVAQAWRQDGKVVCVLGATNRPEALDTALRRAGRFDREIALGIPSLEERHSILRTICRHVSVAADVDFHALANLTPGYVAADLHLLVKEACILAIQRKHAEMTAATADTNNNNNNKSSNNDKHDNSDDDDDDDDGAYYEDLVATRTAGKRTATTTTAVSCAAAATTTAASAADLVDFCVTFDELRAATRRVQPSAMREGFTTIPSVTWDDVGALEDVRSELMRCILQPLRAPRLHRRFGLDQPVGVLLYGPPGCGKTLVAKAIANASGANFISIKGPELLNKFVGESERSVRVVFARGRASAPCVLFFDELDALAPRRGSDRANASSERVVNQLLTELDGVDGRAEVYVIGATNRPDMIDPAMLRPGRLDKLLYVPLPSPAQREAILRTHARRYPVDDAVSLAAVASDARLDGFSGADVAALMREAALSALKSVYDTYTSEQLDALERTATTTTTTTTAPHGDTDDGGSDDGDVVLPRITHAHFDVALSRVRPSVSAAERASYEQLHRTMTQT